VVIFERIKEEVRRGKTVRSAVSSGYARGIVTILDANILTVLTALVLFLFATQQIKGFALTLMIGVGVSMLTAVLATRAMLALLAQFSFFNRPAFMGVSSAQIAVAEAEADAAEAPQGRGRSRRAPGAAPSPAMAPAAGGAASAAPRRPSTAKKKRKKR